MLKRVEQRISELGWRWWLVVFCGSIVLPLLGRYLPFINRAKLVGGVLLVINGLFSWWLGWSLAKHHHSGWWIFTMPLLFIMIDFHFLPKYTRYFALFYLGVSYLSWSITKHNQPQDS